LEIPETATTLLRQEEQIRQTSVSLQELLNEIKQTYSTIPKDMFALFKPHREKVEEALRPGFVAITWSSLNIDECQFAFLNFSTIFFSKLVLS